ncbi:hypothetical protein [Halalkalicoccus jeotgali]|uniref:Uncharacterized protein n=1 Tax=Halalkalicoccus jeotgali (strain DSM 18796 / CECT 7217 / JCM 14584 / KCTC 4019 / B3) TaxID=795797 RepID=D8J3L4_HALJB|nr:hypothetical protein [Halalkalicoccus jeotgali]ADJ15321.1 hypothetical protein HacjB3_09690 [Halalkalicoccus jeotgali B3]ELY35466.1 hypothetical protein C497_12986 [Halalkalicoccus jeotgali B3]
MIQSIGVHFSDDEEDRELYEAIVSELEYGDSRSARMRELLRTGIAVERALDSQDIEIESTRDRTAYIRQAIMDQARAERARLGDR